jgi:hypothetical protein
MSPLTLADVLDLRAYERVREDYRAKIIARKVDRRVALGPVMTLVFECFDTVRFQVQEMARAEKIISDEAIQVELGFSIDGEVVASVPEAAHAAALTRETVTPAVHYVRFGFTETQVASFAGAEEVALVATHPAYEARTPLSPAVHRELVGDLLGTTKPLSIG